MGAVTFYDTIKTDNPKEGFNSLVERAQWEDGHGGYTGTIAEKDGITMSRKPDNIDVDDWVELLDDFDEDDRDQEHYYELKRDFNVYDDKWGDALCIETETAYIFCGWASC